MVIEERLLLNYSACWNAVIVFLRILYCVRVIVAIELLLEHFYIRCISLPIINRQGCGEYYMRYSSYTCKVTFLSRCRS